MKNVGGVAAAIGLWVITVTSGSVFNLNNSVFGGSSYTSGGSAVHLGFCTAGTITDNTVISDITPTSLTLKVRIEALGNNSVNLTIEDTVDSAFLTAETVATFHASGAMQVKVADAVLSRRIYQMLDLRVGSSGNMLRVRCLLPGGVGSSVTFSGWLEM